MTSPSDDRPAWNAGGRPSGVWSGQQESSAQNAPAQATRRSAAPSAADTSAMDTAAADNSHCFQCGKPLERDEIGLYKKLVNRGAREFLCKPCLAARFKMTEADCDTLIAHFKEAGCSMFF